MSEKADNKVNTISIHTALAGCDENPKFSVPVMKDFNPHSPRRL